MTPRWLRPAAIVGGLALLLWANYYLRSTLEESPKFLYSFVERFYPAQVPIIFEQMPKWRWLLPIPGLTGAWAFSTLILTHLLEVRMSPAGVWYLYNALVILVSFGCAFALFRSAVFAFTFAIGMGFGTHFYHAYAVTGAISSYVFAAYNVLLLFTVVQVIRGLQPVWAWRAAFAVSLALCMLGYEGWLDLVVLVVVSTPFVYVLLRRLDRLAEASRMLRMAGVFIGAAILYVLIKVNVGYGQGAGSESDVWLNYGSPWLMADDAIANVFLHPYLSLSNFLPPMLVGANAFFRLGPGPLIESQHGYHTDFLYLVAMNQVFFWRFYAGAALVLLIVAIRSTTLRMWRQPTAWRLALLVCLLMVLVPGSTHSLVKFRPMNAMPAMTYHVTTGVIGASLLIAWLVTNVWQTSRRRPLAIAVVALAWATIFYSALARPALLAHMSAQTGMGEFTYPNPMRKLVEKLGGEYDAPLGMATYHVKPFDPDEPLRIARAQLPDLANALPPPSAWTKSTEAIVVTPEADGALLLDGDTTQFGYQIESPLIEVQPRRNYVVHVKFDTLAGRACPGILTGDRLRWVVPPDGKTPALRFGSGDLTGVRVVVANCHLYDQGNPKTKLRLIGGTYE